MIKLRNFETDDFTELRQEKYNGMSEREIKDTICKWNTKVFNGKYFEMFAISYNECVVGTLSLFQHSDSVISIGPEIFPKYRAKGYAKRAVALALEICKSKGYKIAYQQIMCDNAPSIALHKSLGFETDYYRYKNEKGADVYIFLKSL